MIVIPEPSMLSYNVAENNNNIVVSDSLEDFEKFIFTLDNFIQNCKKDSVKIGVTEKFYQSFYNKIPIIDSENSSVNEIVQELFNVEFWNVAHPLNIETDINIEIDPKCVSNKSLIENDVYEDWFYIFSKFITQELSKFVFLAKEGFSAFKYRDICFSEGKSNYLLSIYRDYVEFKNSDHYAENELIKFLRGSKKMTSCKCFSTGTHDSMWGKKIRKITDIPNDQRDIFVGLVEMGFVIEFKFLDFPNKCTATSPVQIEIKEVIRHENSDEMKCLIKGKGKKQNSQFLCVHTVRGIGNSLSKLENGILSYSVVERILKNGVA